jgi:transcriptional regulator with XRE-family HTH domain
MATAHDRAKAWRESLNLSIADLARLTGYSAVSLHWFEQGLTPPRTAKHIAGKQKSGKIKAAVWQRYRNTCAGVEYQLKAGKKFNFGD